MEAVHSVGGVGYGGRHPAGRPANGAAGAESQPDLGDFRPFELQPGQAMLFWGHQCQHYTVPNETDATRVSLDFRVVPDGWFVHEYPNSHRRDGLMRFAPGAFFLALDGAGTGEWSR